MKIYTSLIGFLAVHLLLGGCAPSPAGGVATTLTLGAVLNQLEDRTDVLVQNTASSANRVIFQAASEADLTIQNAKVAYDDEMNKSLDKVGKKAKETVDLLSAQIAQLEQATANDATKLLAQGQQIANSIPFSKQFPQLTLFNPRYLSMKPGQSDVIVQLSGNFPQSVDDEFKPYIEIENKKIQPAELSSQSVSFSLPTALLAATSTEIKYTKIRVVAPYKKGFIFSSKKIGSFELLIGTLPPLPGKIVVSLKSVKDVDETKHISSPSYNSDSSDDDKRADFSYPPPDGWRVVAGTGRWVPTHTEGDSRGDWRVDFIHDSPDVAYHVETDHHGLGTSGKLEFRIEFDVTRSVKKEIWTPQDVTLSWGSSAAILAGGNDWKVVFDTFDGEHQEFTGPANHRYLSVIPEGTSIRLSVPAAYQVQMYRK